MQMKFKFKKGLVGFAALEGIILTLVISGIILGMGLYAMSQVMTNTGANTTATTAINSTMIAIAGVANWYGILVAVAMIAIVISVLMLLRGSGGEMR